MKLILILYKYIQQAILYKPFGIQNFTTIFQYQTSFQYYFSYIRPSIWDPPRNSLYFADVDRPQCDIWY